MTERPGLDPAGDAINELRLLTRCTCEHLYPLPSGRRDPSCLEAYREDVDLLAAALESARAEVAGLRAARDRVLELCRGLDHGWVSVDEARRLLAVPDTEVTT